MARYRTAAFSVDEAELRGIDLAAASSGMRRGPFLRSLVFATVSPAPVVLDGQESLPLDADG